jgi:hypothetical protein
VPGLPADAWTRADDQGLLFSVWKHGYHACPKALEERLRRLVKGLRQLHARLPGDAPFGHDSLLAAANLWTRDEHRRLVEAILSCGVVPGLRELAGLQHKPAKLFDEYVHQFVRSCERGKPDGITKRIALFREIRELPDARVGDANRGVVEHLRRHGLLQLDAPVIVNRFGTEDVGHKIVKFMREIVNGEVVREEGGLQLPMQLAASLVLVSLGTVVYDREGFHCQRYLYTDGFKSERLFASTRKADARVWYQSMIIDTGDEVPLFRVIEKGNPEVCFEGSSPSNPWTAIAKAVHEKRPGTKKPTISGPECYGLSHPAVQKYMAELPNAMLCAKFIPRKIVVNEEAELSDNVEPPPLEREESEPTYVMKEKSGRAYVVNFKFLLQRAHELRLSEEKALELSLGGSRPIGLSL